MIHSNELIANVRLSEALVALELLERPISKQKALETLRTRCRALKQRAKKRGETK